MTMGLQNLMMFRDNLQQPEPTGIDNLRNLQALTMQGMAAEDYMNEPQPMMMNTGLMSLPVAQAGFGGFVKSITKPFKSIGKGLSKAVKGVVKGVKNIASSPIGQFAIPAAAMFLGPAAFGLPATLGGKVALAGASTGLTSLVGGAKPEDALKRAALAAALTYGGGKLFGSGNVQGASGKTASGLGTKAGTGGATSSYTGGPTDLTNLSYGDAFQPVSTVGDVAAQQAAGLSSVPISPDALSYQPPSVTPQITGAATDQAILQSAQPATIGQRVADFGAGALDKTKEALMKGVQFAKEKPLTTALLGTTALSSLGGAQPIPQQQLAMAGLTPVETDFDKQVFTYKDAQGNILTTEEALRRIQQASQSFGPGGQQVASGVRAGFDRVDDLPAKRPLGSVEELGQFATSNLRPIFMSQSGGMVDPMLSASGGLIGMAYGGSMPMNDMDVKYKEFSGMVGGRGSGMEDNVYMPIVEGESGQQVATLAVSPKEYVVDANTMSLLGNGNPDEGAEIMDKTVKDIRKKATGQTKQQKEIDGLAALNRMRRSV